MNTLAVAVALLMLAGCGNAANDPLQGTWCTESSGPRMMQVSFHGDAWEMLTMRTLNGLMAVEVDSGTYSESGSTITLTTTSSSCQGLQSVTKTTAATFSSGGGYLTLNLGGTAQQFRFGQFILDTTEIGCLDSQNNFTPNPITPVP
jgi:hypothetical protein